MYDIIYKLMLKEAANKYSKEKAYINFTRTSYHTPQVFLLFLKDDINTNGHRHSTWYQNRDRKQSTEYKEYLH